MNIAIVLTHNKGALANQAQINALKALVTKITDTNPVLDESGNQVGTFDSYHYELKNLNLPHSLRLYQVLPFGVTEPSNFYDLDSHNVLYRKGDEDKTGNHPRFFNWGLKRGTDYGADIVLHLDSPQNFTVANLAATLHRLADPTNPLELVELPSGKAVTVRALKEVGQLDETLALAQGMSDYKSRLSQKGWSHG